MENDKGIRIVITATPHPELTERKLAEIEEWLNKNINSQLISPIKRDLHCDLSTNLNVGKFPNPE
jgi:hypothetical protein